MNDSIKQELELIRTENGGFLRPADVVAYAENPDTALHEHFVWDDSEAAKRYRLAQARGIIRVIVVVNQNTSEKIRAFVSLSTDRHAKNGYRSMVSVVDDEILTETLMADALRDLQAFQRRYEQLQHNITLGVVFEAVNKVLAASETETRATA